MKKTMWSESEWMNYAGMFDFQQDLAFRMPVDGNGMEEGQMVMDWGKFTGSEKLGVGAFGGTVGSV
ncbi:MAG: hypothetical protein Q4D62_10920 [Planctomycetia bacterium]|nr:hypothetical protein [Planctomycetia bacterium]